VTSVFMVPVVIATDWTRSGTVRWRWIAINRASLVVTAAFVAVSQGPQGLIWTILAFALGCALLVTGQAARLQLGWRLPAALAALAIWGLPGTVGFMARSAQILPTELPIAVPLYVIILISEILLVAALWQIAGRPDNEPPSSPFMWPDGVRLGVAFVALAVPLILAGLAPGILLQLAGLDKDTFAGWPALLLHTRRSVWAGLLLSGVLGVGLGLWRDRVFAQVRGWQLAICNVVSLDWLYESIVGAVSLAGGGLRYFAILGEAPLKTGLEVVNRLRCHGFSVETRYSPMTLKAQMKLADKLGARKVLMFGDEELACGEITVRDMATKEQTKVKIGNIVNYLQGEKT